MRTRRRGPLEAWRTAVRFLQILGVVLAEALAYRFRRQPLPEHVYRAVVRLGPTFVKLGQVASTRPDLVPARISARLKALQERVPPFPFEQARALVEAFAVFPEEPIASASLSQVYFAELPGGEPVAVKVQRPGIRRLIERDLAILHRLARLAELFSRVARQLRLSVAVGEFGRWTLRELDFEIEGHNAEEFRRNFAGWEDVVFPRVYWSHTTPRVLTMQRVAGLRLDEVPERMGPAFASRLARRLAELEMKMFISDAFFHADLHPGNIFFQPDGRIAVLDLGMVGRMSAEQRDRFLAYWIAITRRQRDRAFHHLLKMAESTEGADLEGFRLSYDVNLDRFYDADLSERSLAQTYLEIVVNGARFGVVFPPEMILQAKAVVTAEALDLVLAPDFRFTDEVRPIVARKLAERAAPRQLRDRLWGSLAEWVLLGESVPAGEAPSDDEPDERAFRRQAKTALADAWADATVDTLQDWQADAGRYTSGEYWAERPQRQAALSTVMGLMRLLAVQLRRAQQEAALPLAQPTVPEPVFSTSGNGHKPVRSPAERGQHAWQAFLDELEAEGEHIMSDELVRTLDHVAGQVDRYAEPNFWEGRSDDEAALRSALTLLRFLAGQAGQAVHESVALETNAERTDDYE